MTPDLSNMEPVICPDCKQQLFVMVRKDNPNGPEIGGCKCDPNMDDLPDSVMFAIEDTRLFLFKRT
jgi:hypothetical protein